MSKQLVFTGTIANDKTGDALRNAFIKINSNFTELYTGQAAASSTGATAPTSPAEGWLWYNTTNSNTYIYTSGNWVLTNPAYTLPKATASVLGGIKVGANLAINSDGVLSANAAVVDRLTNGSYSAVLGSTGALTLPDGLILPVSTLTESVESAEVIIADLLLDAVVDYSTGEGDNIPQNTYGTHPQIGHPWSVIRFTTTPSPALQIEDLIFGAGIIANNQIQFVGSGSYQTYIITNQTFTGVIPTQNTVVSITRPVTNAALAIETDANTDISLIAGTNGRILTSSHLIPITSATYDLGTPTRRFRRLWLGAGSIYVQDEVTGADLRLTAINNNFVVAGSAGLTVGEFTLHDNSILLDDPTREIYIGSIGATAPVTLRRTLQVRNSTDEFNLLKVDQQGRVDVISDIATDPTKSAMNIISARTRDVQSPNNLGVLLQLTGSSTAPSRIYHDSYGTANYSAFIGRHARGNSLSPTQTMSGDIISRIGANPYDDTGFASISTSRIDFVNTENQTSTAHGSKIELWTVENGSTTIAKRASISSEGITLSGSSSGLTFNDASKQTTAWTGSTSYTNITGLSTVAHTNAYSDLTGLPDVITTANAGTGISLTRSGSTLGINATGVQTLVAAAGTGQIAVSDSGSKNLTLTLPQAIATTSNVQFNNLTITGTLTATNFNIEVAPTIAGKTLLLASGATTAANIDQGGILLGPVGQSFSRSFLYDLSTDHWNTDGGGLTTLELVASDIKVSGNAHFGTAYNDYDFSNATIQTDTNVNSYSQNVIKNHSSGSNASADFVAVNNIGDDSVNYIDVGINSSTFANVDYSIMGANSGYLYINGGDLTIGTQTATKNISFHTGGTTADKLRATLSDTGLAVVGTVSATTFSGALSGNASTVTNGVYTTGSYSNPSWITALAASKVSGLATVATSGSYTDLINKPTIPAAQVNSDWNAVSGLAAIFNKPTIPAAQVNSDWNAVSGLSVILNKPTLFSGAYADLTGKPTLFSGAYADLTGKPTLATVATSGSYADLTNKPTFVSALTTSDGLSVNTAATGSVSITNTDKGSSQFIFKSIVVAGQTTVGASVNSDSLTLVAGTNMSITTSGKNITFNGASQNAIKTISVLGDGSYTATAPDSSVIFAPAGRMSLNIVGNTISITDNAKGHKKHRILDKHGVYTAADVDMTVPEDTISFIEGKNMSITSDAVNKTITFNALKSTRDAGTLASGTLTLDHATDDIVYVIASGSITIAHTNMSPGREVKLIIKNTSGVSSRTITTGVTSGNMSNGDSTTTLGITRSGVFIYTSMGTTTTDLYCQAAVA